MGHSLTQVKLRMPESMRARLRLSASANRRSMNSEIVHYLDRALAAEEMNDPASVGVLPGRGSTDPCPETANERADA